MYFSKNKQSDLYEAYKYRKTIKEINLSLIY